MLGDEDLYAKSPKVDFDFRGFISDGVIFKFLLATYQCSQN